MTKPKASLTFLLLLLMSAVIVLERWHTLDEPLDQDIAGYAVLSHEMLSGRKLYSDLWERKPPLIFVTFAAAECVTGYGPREIFLLSVLAAVGTMFFIYRAGGLFAAALWMLLCGDIWLAGDQPNAEVFVNFCLAGGFAMLLRDGPAHPRWRAIGVGLFFAAATLFKHHVIVVCAALLVVDSIRPDRTIKGANLGSSAIATGVIVAAWLILSGYFFEVGRFSDFYSALFQQNITYAGSIGANLAHSLLWKNLFSPATRWTLAPLALLTLWIICGRKNRDANSWAMVVAFAVSAWIAVALPGYFWAHYYQLLLPPLCVAGGWAAANLRRSDPRLPALVRYLAIAAIFVAEACWQTANYRLSPEQIAREKYEKSDLPEQQALGNLLGRTLSPSERFWELGEENEMYFAAKKSPPSGLLYLEPIESGPQRNAYADRLLADLNRTRPDAVIINQRWIAVLPQGSGILPWVTADYASDGGRLSRGTYHVYLRRGSDLARRLGGQ